MVKVTITRDSITTELGHLPMIYKSVDEAIMQSNNSDNLENVIAKFSFEKFLLGPKVTFQGVDFDAPKNDTLTLKPHLAKIDKIRNFCSPTTEKELQSFMGIAETFHRCNPNTVKLSEQMRHLNKKRP